MPQHEILTPHRFYIQLTLDGSDDHVDGTFLECRGFQQTQAPIEICEVSSDKSGKGTKIQTIRTKLPGNVKSGNLTLRRGMTSSIALWNWFQAVQQGNWAKQRRNVCLTIYDQAAQPQARYVLSGAWPSSYKITDVNARSTEIEIEEVEIAFEEFTREKIS